MLEKIDFESLLKNTDYGLLLLDELNKLISANNAAAKYFDEDIEILKGQEIELAVKNKHTDELQISLINGNRFKLKPFVTKINEKGKKYKLIHLLDVTDYTESLEKFHREKRYNKILNHIIESLRNNIEPKAVLEDTVSLIVDNIERADTGAAYQIRDNKAFLKASKGYPDWFIQKVSVIEKGKGFTWKAIESGENIFENDIDNDEYIGPSGIKLGTKSYVSLPIKIDNVITGVININSFSKDAFDKEEADFFVKLRKHIELAIKSTRIVDEIRYKDFLFKSFMQNIPGSAFIKDKDRRYIYASPNYEKALQIPKDKILNRKAEEIWSEDISNKIYRNDTRVFKNRKSYQFVESFPVNNKTTHWIVTKFPIYIPEYNKDYIGGISLDVTREIQNKEFTNMQTELLNEISDPVLSVNNNSEITYFNNAAKIKFGLNYNTKELKVYEYLKFDQDIVNLIELTKVQKYWSGELTCTDTEFHVQHYYARFKYFDSFIGNEDDVISVYIKDITDTKQAEKILRHTQRLDNVGSLASGIAHDLNNMLMPISISIEWIKDYEKYIDNSNKDRFNSLTDNIQKGSMKASRLVSQILNLSSSSEGQFSILKLEDVLKDLLEVLNTTFPKEITIIADIPEDLKNIKGNSIQIYQVLLNICVNARDAMENGGLLSIKISEKEISDTENINLYKISKGMYYCIYIEDTGEGISENDLKKIFNPYYTSKSEKGGSGLGLAICSDIIKEHSGAIDVSSVKGVGTTFTVFLPINMQYEHNTLNNKIINPEKGNYETVLIADDEEPILNVLSLSLENNNYNSILARDGPECIAKFIENKNDIDLILADVSMPVLNGVSAIKTIRKIDESVKVILMSGVDGSLEKIRRSADFEINGYIKKPFTITELLGTVNSALTDDK